MMQMDEHDAIQYIERTDALNTNTNNGKLGSQTSLNDSNKTSSNNDQPASQMKRPESKQSGKTISRPSSKTSVNGERPGSKISVNAGRPGSKTSVNAGRPGSKTSVIGERPSSKTSVNGERPSSKTSATGERPSSKTSVNGDRPSSKINTSMSQASNGKLPGSSSVTGDAPGEDGVQRAGSRSSVKQDQQKPSAEETSKEEKQEPEEQTNQEQQPNQETNQEQQPNQEMNQEQQPSQETNQEQQPNQETNQEQQPNQETNQEQQSSEQTNQEQQSNQETKQESQQEQQQAQQASPPEDQQEEVAEELSPLRIKLNGIINSYKAKSMPKDDVVNTLKGLIEVLQEQEKWDNDISLDALKKITRVYFDYKSCRKTNGNVMVDMEFPESCLKMYRIFNNVGVFSSDNVWFPTYYILNNLWNFTDASHDLGRGVAKAGFINVLTANVTHTPYLENQKSKNVKYVLKSSLSILSNVARCDGVRQYYEDNKVVDALKPFLIGEQDVMLKTLSIMCLSVLVTEEENARMEDSGTIPFIVKNIKSALANSKGRSHGFTSVELAETLGRIAVNDDNKKKIVSAGALPLLVEMLQSKAEDKQYTAARLLWTLCFDSDVKKQIEDEPGCVKALDALTNSENSGVKKQASGTLWKIQEEQKKKDVQDVSKDMEGHIMISYNWDNKEMVLAIKDRLQAEGYKVWVDVEQMGGSTLEAMALAVENARCVLVCLSEKYKLSPNCRTEAEYTFQLKKPLVPLMMQRYYKPDGWLGMLCGAKMYVNFDGKYDFDYAFNILSRELTNTLAPPRDEVDKGAVVQQKAATVAYTPAPMDHTAPAPAPAATARFRQWSKEEVGNWVSENQLTGLSTVITGLDGKKLYQLCQMKTQAPEFFFNYLSNKLDLALNDMLHLTDAMETLE